MTNGELLLEQRKKLGLTQEQCAKRAGIACRRYQAFENNERSLDTCTFMTACSVIAALEMDITGFYAGKVVHSAFHGRSVTKVPVHPQLRNIRMTLGITQKQVADKASISLRQYQKFESGERDLRNASFQIACKVIEALGLDITLVYYGDATLDIVARLKELKGKRALYLENFTLEDLEIIRREAPEEYALLQHRPPIDDSDFHREEPLYREDFTDKELELMERLAPVEYKHLRSRNAE